MPYARPKGDSRFQEVSNSKVGLPSLELDGEFNALKDYLNSLGSYTANVSEWVIEDGVPTFVSLTQFTLVGDLTTTYLPYRALIAILGATPVYTAVDSSSYSAGTGLTTVTVRDEVLTASLSQVKYGLLGPETDKLSVPITALTVPVVSKAVDYVATKHDAIILVDASGGSRSITLPQVSLVSSATRVRRFMVVKIDSSLNHVTVVPNAGDSINGAANYVLFEQYQRAELLGHGGTDWKQVARKTVEAGRIVMTGRAAAPAGWFLCDGAAVSRTTYADLFDAIGTAFGVGDGSTTFNLPDLRSRTPIGVGTGAGLSARAMGDQIGEETHPLTEAEMPKHYHQMVGPNAITAPQGTPAVYGNYGGGTPDDTAREYGTWSTGKDAASGGHGTGVGDGDSHNNMQPSLAVNFIIKV